MRLIITIDDVCHRDSHPVQPGDGRITTIFFRETDQDHG